MGRPPARGRTGGGSVELVVAGLEASLVYTYAYFVFGTGFNDLFLLHVAVFAVGLVALGLLAAALGGMWVYFAAHNAVTGAVPAGSMLVETDAVVHLGMALDLALLVPLYAVAALLLVRDRGTKHGTLPRELPR